MKLSILTATYNRAGYLQKLYESILSNMRKSNIDIEWIIIDDGSTDDTKKVVEEWKAVIKPNLEIKYIYQNNAGKMSAINRGVKKATGDLIIDCDSDDFFAENAFETIKEQSLKLFQEQELYALCFLKEDTRGNISRKKVFERLFENYNV